VDAQAHELRRIAAWKLEWHTVDEIAAQLAAPDGRWPGGWS
jgi:hypothetical protein